jgi:hypothetical protein
MKTTKKRSNGFGRNLLLAGMAAMLLAFGLVVVGCDDGNGDDGGNGGGGGEELPAAAGTNALGGKTYFEQNRKIVFEATADGAKSGNYKVWSTIWSEEDREYELVDGKYKYTETENGTYSWNETAKTVTLKPEKIAQQKNDGTWDTLQNSTQFRDAQKAQIDEALKSGYTQEQINAELASQGFSSVPAYLDYVVNQVFANVTDNYAFSTDGLALFLDQALPANKGSNELSGKEFNGMKWDNATDKRVKDTDQKYVFTASGYTYTDTRYSTSTETGTYAYDSSQKYVYLKRATADRGSSYSTQTSNSGYFNSAAEYNAAQVNSQYNRVDENPYNATNLTIGWED